MRLSDIISEISFKEKYSIENEREFEFLGLVAQEMDYKICSFIDDPKYIPNVKSNVTMLLVNKETAVEVKKLLPSIGICVVEKPRILFFEIHNALADDERYIRKNFPSIFGEKCKISSLSSIAENNVVIGNNVIIEEFVVIRENVVIEDDAIIRSGTVIGSVGYEFKRDDNRAFGIKHLGGVVIKKGVEVQHNTCVDKAVYPWDDTVLGEESKIDNLVHISHGVKIGKRTMIVALSGIGGRTVIGDDTWIGFGATVVNGTQIGNKSRVNMGAVVTRAVADNASVSGNFAIDHKRFVNHIKSIAKD
ncbi:UDP-3-O-[3-hydroxymyristoyl] glucosamine N-acyltransferase [Lachnospiraceae bacterium PF1-22]|uniref:UDP-3-O-(3-hydroxymyristoyl)glucosamine N-acyltransferase n=1 Tax=Ohessyouella blattaphilus TaxID=2949333 RepID=UPI003E260B94